MELSEEQKIIQFPVECYSRVTGYLTPISQWSDAKLAEFNDRKVFNIDNNN